MNKYRMVQIPEKAKVFHFDLTTRCNLHCPMCPRVTAKLKVKSDFDLDLLSKVPIEDTESILLCGRTGDPSLYPKLFEFIRACKKRAPNTKINISTNGCAQDREWWKKLAELLKDIKHSVIFCIDGLGDKLEIYRKGANYYKVIQNATSFINNGGHAVWKFVTFKHNEHQLEEARELSNIIGFKEFIPIFSFHYEEGYEKPPKYSDLETKYERCDSDNTYIHCRMEKLGEFFITYDGYVIPCCHINPAREDGFFDNIDKLNLKDFSFEEMIRKNYFKKISIKVLFYPLCNNFCRTRIDRWANTRIDDNNENKKKN
jgi:MoaA/NifB/PqqE/SkfB family radical SAM enzyme